MVTNYTFKKTEDGKIVAIKEPDNKALTRKKMDDVKTLRIEIALLKGRIAELEEQAKLDQMYIDDSTAMIDRLNGDIEVADANVTMWMSKYEEAEELRKKAEHERDLLKEMIHDKPATKKYKVRQIAILALALCRKALVVPKNKKKIAELFGQMTGLSHNTISQNLCDIYTDEEIQVIAEPLKESMPELAEYLLKNKFAG